MNRKSDIPDLLFHRFPPSPRRLLEIARTNVDASILWVVAEADYGFMADEAFLELRSIRDTLVIPAPMSGHLLEVLELTRWSDPERPNPPPFRPGPEGRRGHAARMFACAALLTAASDSAGRYLGAAEDSTFAACLVSARVLGGEYSEAVGCFMTSELQRVDYPVLVAVGLLTLAMRLQSNRMEESELDALAEWVLTVEQARRPPGPGYARDQSSEAAEQGTEGTALPGALGAGRRHYREPEPVAFSVQQGLWQPIAVELKTLATGIRDAAVRENVQLCALVLDPGWDTSP